MQAIDTKIKHRIFGSGRGSLFTPTHFIDLGGRYAVDKALSRLGGSLWKHTVVVIRPEAFHRTGEHVAKFSDINSDPVELTLDNFVKITGLD